MLYVCGIDIDSLFQPHLFYIGLRGGSKTQTPFFRFPFSNAYLGDVMYATCDVGVGGNGNVVVVVVDHGNMSNRSAPCQQQLT